MTRHEKKLWYDFLCKYPVRFQRQKAIGNYIADFYCAKARLIIELDGSGHYRYNQKIKDTVRTAELEGMNLRVLRFRNIDIDNGLDMVCRRIDNVVKEALSLDSLRQIPRDHSDINTVKPQGEIHMKKQLMLGNAAVARGAYEAGVRVVSSYPGTPSTEITENIVNYPEIYCEWAPNEKVAAEVAIGASIGGARAMSCMKHVGLNVMADPVFTASYTGVNGGLVLCVADDQGMHSSQNEQDSRHYAKAAKIMMLEPSDSGECKEYTKLAYALSEEFDTPVFLRLSTRVSHSQSMVELCEREGDELKDYEKNIPKYVMMPGNAIKRHVVVEERMKALSEYAETCPVNTVEDNGAKVGIISAGIAYEYAKEAMGEEADYLKLGMVYPLPEKLIRDFAEKHDKVYVIEELDPFIEEHCRIIGADVIGKEAFTLLGEYTPAMIRKAITGEEPPKSIDVPEAIPVRPPVMCAGGPHRGTFYVLKKLGLTVSCDIGC
ncbi:MAG: DUF559 domain-containing protein [Clostridia bacterium]|nr:DUF559 domain-containing protein [Clostridia bacterium]